jgi:hypothetical protein
MSITLHYAISKRTPPSEKVLKNILHMQDQAIQILRWHNEGLSFAPDRLTARPTLGFSFAPFSRFAPAATIPFPETREAPRPVVDGCVTGSTNVRQSLWNAHFVASFLRLVSARFPELLLELRDDGAFVLPGAVWIKGGKAELNRAWLDEQRARALASGEIQAAIPFLWAEQQAVEGNFFRDGDATDILEEGDIAALNVSWDQLRSASASELADAAIAGACTVETHVKA